MWTLYVCDRHLQNLYSVICASIFLCRQTPPEKSFWIDRLRFYNWFFVAASVIKSHVVFWNAGINSSNTRTRDCLKAYGLPKNLRRVVKINHWRCAFHDSQLFLSNDFLKIRHLQKNETENMKWTVPLNIMWFRPIFQFTKNFQSKHLAAWSNHQNSESHFISDIFKQKQWK